MWTCTWCAKDVCIWTRTHCAHTRNFARYTVKQYATTLITKTHHHTGKTVDSRSPVPNGRIRPSRPKATWGLRYRNPAMRKRKMDTIQMRWFFRVIPSITYGNDEICEHVTCDACDGCDGCDHDHRCLAWRHWQRLHLQLQQPQGWHWQRQVWHWQRQVWLGRLYHWARRRQRLRQRRRLFWPHLPKPSPPSSFQASVCIPRKTPQHQ